MSQESIIETVRQHPAYKYGYLKESIYGALTMMNEGLVKEGKQKLKDALRMTEGVNFREREVCSHEKVREANGGYCVIDYYCADCDKWLGDKDVS